jgi:hypothetical protein
VDHDKTFLFTFSSSIQRTTALPGLHTTNFNNESKFNFHNPWTNMVRDIYAKFFCVLICHFHFLTLFIIIIIISRLYSGSNFKQCSAYPHIFFNLSFYDFWKLVQFMLRHINARTQRRHDEWISLVKRSRFPFPFRGQV